MTNVGVGPRRGLRLAGASATVVAAVLVTWATGYLAIATVVNLGGQRWSDAVITFLLAAATPARALGVHRYLRGETDRLVAKLVNPTATFVTAVGVVVFVGLTSSGVP